MKVITTSKANTLALMFMLFLCSAGLADKSKTPKTYHRVDLDITGASCGACHIQILTLLQRTPGVLGADLERGHPLKAHVLFDSTKTSTAELIELLRAKRYGVSQHKEVIGSQSVSSSYKRRLNTLSDVNELHPPKPKMP